MRWGEGSDHPLRHSGGVADREGKTNDLRDTIVCEHEIRDLAPFATFCYLLIYRSEWITPPLRCLCSLLSVSLPLLRDRFPSVPANA